MGVHGQETYPDPVPERHERLWVGHWSVAGGGLRAEAPASADPLGSGALLHPAAEETDGAMQLPLGRHVALGGIVLGARLLAGVGQGQPALGLLDGGRRPTASLEATSVLRNIEGTFRSSIPYQS